jgi:hypothetical protein
MARRLRWPARAWLPVAVSLAVHALLILAGTLLTSGKDAHAGAPVPVDTLVVDDGNDVTILDSPSPKRPGPRAVVEPARGDEELSEAFKATVGDLPVVGALPAVPASGEPAKGPGGSSGTAGAAAEGGGGHGTGVLRAPATTKRVVYVIDRSLSMGLNGALAAAKRELLAGVESLPADGQFQVILYNGLAEPLAAGGRTGLLPADEENRRAVARTVEGLRAEGGTDHLAALRRAVGLGAEVIFFVTDADEMTVGQVRNVTLLNGGRAVIHAVELNNDGEPRAETPLKLLARLNGGTHRVVPVGR